MAQNRDTTDFFKRMTRLFRSGPAIQRNVRGTAFKVDSDAAKAIQMAYRNLGYAGFGVESKTLPIGSRNESNLNRTARYGEFHHMDLVTPEISTALDIYCDEIAGADERGHCFHIYCEKPEIKRALDELFYEILDIENNIRSWIRNLCKHGDFFLYHEVIPKHGIVAALPLPVNQVERIEGIDPDDPFAVQFKSMSNGKLYENWQVTHFRIIGNETFYPYGTSILDPVRRTWAQLVMAEDSMLTYRVVRGPERKVFNVEVGNSNDNDMKSFMEQIKSQIRSLGSIDSQSGRMDYKFNPVSAEMDLFVPMRDGNPVVKIDPLPAAQNTTQIEDVQYLQAKMFSGLKVPKAYMNFDENLSSKATLAQTDIRFSRTIAALQKIPLAEFEKIAAIHLYAKGFTGEDLVAFRFKFSNPSTVAIQQKLSLLSTKFDVAQKAMQDPRVVDVYWVQKYILEIDDDEIANISRGQKVDKLREQELAAISAPVEDTSVSQQGDPFNPSNYGVGGATVPKSPEQAPMATPNTDSVGFTFDQKEQSFPMSMSGSLAKNPIKANPTVEREKHNARRRMGPGEGAYNLSMPDFGKMLSPDNKYAKDVYGLKNDFRFESKEEGFSIPSPRMVRNEIMATLNRFDKLNNIRRTIDGRMMLAEEVEEEAHRVLEIDSTKLKSQKNVVVENKEEELIEIEIQDSGIIPESLRSAVSDEEMEKPTPKKRKPKKTL